MNNNLIEAILYVKGVEGVSPRELKAISPLPIGEIRNFLKSFANYFNELDLGIQVVEFNDVFKFATREKHKEKISLLVTEVKKQKLSNAAIETAGIIAYKQPITKREINEIRNIESDAVVNTLLQKGIIEQKGNKDTPGSPGLFKITNKFYDYFQIKSLTELPKFKQFNEKDNEENFDLFASQRED